MNPRIEKKLSKRIAHLHPTLYRKAWVDHDHSEYAYEENSNVRHCLSVGGGTDYWGEGCDAYTVWADWKMNWPWHGPFEPYPAYHKLEYYPNTEGFNPTTRNLIKLAADCEIAASVRGSKP